MEQHFTKNISQIHLKEGQGFVLPFIMLYQRAQKLIGKTQ